MENSSRAASISEMADGDRQEKALTICNVVDLC